MEDRKKTMNQLLKIPGVHIASDVLKTTRFVATPFPSFNNMTGGGYPIGRYTVIAGPAQVAKTTMVLQTIAHQQSINPDFVAVYVDAEHALDLEWTKKLGVDTEKLIVLDYRNEKKSEELQVSDLNSNEDAFTMEWYTQKIRDIVALDIADMVVVDSIGALLPKQEKGKDMDEETMMVLPKKMNQFFRTNTPLLAKSKTAFIWIGHVYTVPSATVSFDRVKGGNGIAYWASLRLIQRRGSKSDALPMANVMCADGQVRQRPTGWPCRIKMEKSKVNDKEDQEIVIPFLYGRGLDSTRTTILSSLAFGLASQKGAWITSEFILDENGSPGSKVQGKDALVDYFISHPEQMAKLSEKLTSLSMKDADESGSKEVEEQSEPDIVGVMEF